MNKNRVTPTEVGVVGVCTDFSCNNCKKKSNKRLLKIFAASGLAFFMGIGTLCGVVFAPMGATSASNAGDLAALAQSPDRAQEKALHDAGVLSGGDLGLDPENDPVVWVTDNGFEIKSHDVSVSSGTTTVSSTSWKYVTLGSWNWIIIGYSTKNLTQGTGHVSVATPDNYNRNTYTTWLDGATPKLVPDTTDAGNSIKSAVQAQSTNFYNTSSFTYKLKSVFTNAVGASEIPAGCVLCLCANTTGNSHYNETTSKGAYFPDSDLDTAMTTVYNNIKSAAGNAIQSTSLTTCWHNGSAKTQYTHSEYLFPLAFSRDWSGYTQNYCVETYLNSNAKRDIDAYWWLRTGNVESYLCVLCVDKDGSLSNNTGAGPGGQSTWYHTFGVRPAFVLKL